MRNLFVYYISILLPFALLGMAARLNLVTSEWFVALFFSYFIYRQFTDTWRLRSLGVIQKITVKTIADPLLQLRYFRELYWSKA